MTEWRLHIYWQGGDEALPARQTRVEVQADAEAQPPEDWMYVERRDTPDGPWTQVEFYGFAPGLPDAWNFEDD